MYDNKGKKTCKNDGFGSTDRVKTFECSEETTGE